MSDDEMRTAIAKACGWKLTRARDGEFQLVNPECKIVSADWEPATTMLSFSYKLPDYLNDLNAMHEAEKALTAEQADKFFTKLMFCEGGISEPHWVYPDGTAYGRGARYSHSAHATARQRAEAFIATVCP